MYKYTGATNDYPCKNRSSSRVAAAAAQKPPPEQSLSAYRGQYAYRSEVGQWKGSSAN